MHSAKIAIIPLSSQRDSNVSQIKVHFQTGRCCCRGNCFIISRLSFTGEKTPVRNGFGFRIVLPHQEVLDDLDGFLLDFAAETMSGAWHYLEGGVLVGLVGFF